MWRTLLIPLALLPAATAAAQAAHQLRDHRSGAPVPWATVKVLHRAQGAVADEQGRFSLALDAGDTALVSSVGYAPKRLTALADEILLEPMARPLDTIHVRPTVAVRNLLLGNGVPYLQQRVDCRYGGSGTQNGCYPWGVSGADQGKTEFAERVALPDSTKPYRLLRLWFPTRKDDDCYGGLLIRIYTEDTLTGLPGEELFVKRIDVTRASVHRNRLKIVADLSADNLVLPPGRAFFVSTGWPPDAKTSCFACILLFGGTPVNTFTRTMVHNDYNWYAMRMPGKDTGGVDVHTLYAAELEELRYK